MTPEPLRWPEIRAVFDACAEAAPDQRDALIAASGLTGADLAELHSLLAHVDTEDPARPDPLAGVAATRLLGPETLPAGHRLGAWAIVRLLGSGGMGEVYEARRADGQYEGRAAIKRLKRGMDSAAVLRRFEQERQALARLSHPHIARLLDAGADAHGLPYFVLEYVEGRHLDEAARGLPLRERLGLFLQLADAVAHAHRHLLVHRDLKPGNVLVDGDGQVKLLDFGIAKALDPDDDDATHGGPWPYTPHYASPEQMRGEPVSTATDVYSLGVLLHLVLTGQRPTGQHATTPAEARRAVLEEQPTVPSQRMQIAGDSLQADPRAAAVQAALRGDGDQVLLKALEKLPERRYVSVDALAEDLRAWRDGRPVAARGAGWAYRARRFIGRNRLASAGAAVGVLGMATGLLLSLAQIRESEQARALAERRFQQVRQIAGSMVFSHHDRLRDLPGTLPARAALLEDGARYLDALLAEAPPDPLLAREVAETYLRIAVLQGESLSPNLGLRAQARRSLDQAIALLPRYIDSASAGPEALAAAGDMWLARAAQQQRDAQLQAAAQSLAQARALAERHLRLQPGAPQAISRLASVAGRLGALLGGGGATLGRLAEAAPQLQTAVDLLQAQAVRAPAEPQWAHELAWACQLQANLARLEARLADARRWADCGVAQRDRAARAEPGNVHFQTQTVTARMTLAMVLSASGAHDDGLALQDDAAAILQRLARSDPENQALGFYAGLMRISRTWALVAAGRDARPGLAAMLAGLPPPEAREFDAARLRALGLTWGARALQAHEPARALALATQAAAAMAEPPQDDGNAARRWARAQAEGEMAQALRALGRHEESARLARQALASWATAPAEFSAWVARDRRLSAPG